MSIITEALKKAQSGRNNGSQKVEEIGSSVLSPVEKLERPTSRKTTVFVALLIVVTLLVAASVIFFFSNRHPQSVKAVQQQTVHPVKKEIPATPSEEEMIKAPEKIKLEAPAVKPDEITSSVLPQKKSAAEPIVTARRTAAPVPAQPDSFLKPTIRSKPASDSLMLTGIMYSASSPKAVINGELVEEGEVISGYSIEQIQSQKVIVVNNGNRSTLKLK